PEGQRGIGRDVDEGLVLGAVEGARGGRRKLRVRDGDDALEGGARAARGYQRRRQLRVGEQEPGARVVEDVADLVGVEARVDRDQYTARERDAEVRLEDGRPVGGHAGDPGAGAQPR